MMQTKIVILDFGSQYTQLIARRIRELNVYCEIIPYNKLAELTPDIAAIILSGSPFSALDDNALHINLNDFLGKVPVLGICYGAQYIASQCGGQVERSANREYGKAKLTKHTAHALFEGVKADSQVWMSHADTIKRLPTSFYPLAQTEHIPVAAFASEDGQYEMPVLGLQFHPEVTHSLEGAIILSNFLFKIVGIKANWSPAQFVDQSVLSIRKEVGDDRVILGLSGGVDSSVAALLLHRAIGDNLHCIFVNNGLLRKREYDEVVQSYQSLGLNIKRVDASSLFLEELKGIEDPEDKRKTIGRVFIEVFEKEAKSVDGAKWLAQGTIYPDVIESVSVHGPSVTIKSHHNVGGLPEKLNLEIIEPIRSLFKDEVRRVGAELRLPAGILNRHPFPGPGLGIRILGEVTAEKVEMLQEADDIYVSKLKEAGWYDRIWQAGAVLLPIHSVGVMGDERTYEQVVALRAVNSSDGMTAEWTQLPYELMADISTSIINQVKGINRVVYDISTKPPSTIEWE